MLKFLKFLKFLSHKSLLFKAKPKNFKTQNIPKFLKLLVGKNSNNFGVHETLKFLSLALCSKDLQLKNFNSFKSFEGHTHG